MVIYFYVSLEKSWNNRIFPQKKWNFNFLKHGPQNVLNFESIKGLCSFMVCCSYKNKRLWKARSFKVTCDRTIILLKIVQVSIISEDCITKRINYKLIVNHWSMMFMSLTDDKEWWHRNPLYSCYSWQSHGHAFI